MSFGPSLLTLVLGDLAIADERPGRSVSKISMTWDWPIVCHHMIYMQCLIDIVYSECDYVLLMQL